MLFGSLLAHSVHVNLIHAVRIITRQRCLSVVHYHNSPQKGVVFSIQRELYHAFGDQGMFLHGPSL